MLFQQILSTVVVATVVGFSAAGAAVADVSNASLLTDIPRVEGIAFGARAADWKGQGLVIRALAGETATLRKAGEFEAVARLGWNDEGVLLQVDVTDSTPFEETNDDALFKGDSVELCLMQADKTGGMAQLIATPGRTKENPAPRVRLFDYRNREFKKNAPPFQPRVATTANGRGYTLDLLLPWASMKIRPEIGVVVGVRFCVNDSDGQTAERAIWVNHDTTAEWMALAPVRLAAKPAGAKPVAVWGGYDDFKSTYVNVIAEPALLGRSVYVLAGKQVKAHAQLVADGGRAVASIVMPFPAMHEAMPDLTVQVDGGSTADVPLPDAKYLRLEAFLSGQGQLWREVPAWLKPECRPAVFAGSEFPRAEYPDPERIRQLVGDYTIDTIYFDASFRRVQRPNGQGRYGAITTVISSQGYDFRIDQTLYCVREGAPQEGASAKLLAARITNPGATDFEANKMDRDWWHALRTRLGTAVRYEYVVQLPKGYEDNPEKRWPVIFYLHGSGGGDNPRHVRDSAIQKAAREKTDFPFIAVSLRSPGGWQPPAVHDVIDQVAATCRTDPTRYYLTGFSMGGMGTWAVVQDRPERFAAIAPVGGRHGDLTRAPALKGVAAWVINGADDKTTTSADALQMVDALKAAGAEVKWTEIPDAGHVDSLDTAYEWDELYAWFLQHRRS